MFAPGDVFEGDDCFAVAWLCVQVQGTEPGGWQHGKVAGGGDEQAALPFVCQSAPLSVPAFSRVELHVQKVYQYIPQYHREGYQSARVLGRGYGGRRELFCVQDGKG